MRKCQILRFSLIKAICGPFTGDQSTCRHTTPACYWPCPSLLTPKSTTLRSADARWIVNFWTMKIKKDMKEIWMSNPSQHNESISFLSLPKSIMNRFNNLGWALPHIFSHQYHHFPSPLVSPARHITTNAWFHGCNQSSLSIITPSFS